jgi:hypothetical protein
MLRPASLALQAGHIFCYRSRLVEVPSHRISRHPFIVCKLSDSVLKHKVTVTAPVILSTPTPSRRTPTYNSTSGSEEGDPSFSNPQTLQTLQTLATLHPAKQGLALHEPLLGMGILRNRTQPCSNMLGSTLSPN